MERMGTGLLGGGRSDMNVMMSVMSEMVHIEEQQKFIADREVLNCKTGRLKEVEITGKVIDNSLEDAQQLRGNTDGRSDPRHSSKDNSPSKHCAPRL